MPRIKQERGARTPALTDDGYSESPSDQIMRIRHVRSDAPSIDTRLPARSAPSHRPIGEDSDEEDVMIMEIKPVTPKAEDRMEPASMASRSMQGSFIGPNLALRNIGQKLKDINDALGELQSLGVQHVAPLPELVLVGDQSSGKSSLMSAIAGLRLPRSSGTCTRCPIHIRVSRADYWSCEVFLKEDYEFRPPDHPLTERDVTNTNRFPPWVELEPSRRTQRNFKTVRDQFDADEIETVLRCAQIAILNPTTPYQMFVPKLKGEAPDSARQRQLESIRQHEQRSEAQFSPNTVALVVKGPDLADLNFYDLPGVFMTASRAEDTFLECVVQNLTYEYISRKNALILCAVPMNQDTENSLALKIIRRLQAEDRCIGVITKADLLPRGDEHAASGWLAMLNGQAHKTGFGYFITSRQGGDLEDQTRMEEAFFNRTAYEAGHWPEVFEPFKDRCGVEKLKAFLSLKLGEKFATILPEVKQKVEDRLRDLNEQLQQYPDPPANPEMEIMTSLADFTSRVQERILHHDFESTWHRNFATKFKDTILKLKPKFNVKEPSRQSGSASGGDSPAANPFARKRVGQVMDLTQPSPKRQRAQPANGTIKVEAPDSPSLPATPRHPRPAAVGNSPYAARGFKSKTLMDIRELINRAAVPGQLDLVSTTVYQPLFIEAATAWAPHLERFIEATIAFLQREVFAILDTAFADLKNRAVYKESFRHMKAFIETHKKELRDQLMLLYKLETKRLYTTDAVSLKHNKAAELEILVRHRNLFRIAAYNGEELGPIPKVDELTEEELRQEAARMEKELKKFGPDPFEKELAVAAYIRGYYLTAANRFVDYVSIHVMAGLLPQVAATIKTYLHDKLGLVHRSTTRETIDRLMSEGPEIEQKRRDLRVEMEKFNGAMAIIVNLENREREQASQYTTTNGGSGPSQSHDLDTMLDHSEQLRHADGSQPVGADQRTVYSATQVGDA
ncbi:hypothetical protein VTK26DRAFT_555 [Humicola hyalothermophila]